VKGDVGIVGQGEEMAHDEEMTEPHITRSRSVTGPFGFNEGHFYQYTDKSNSPAYTCSTISART